MKNKFPFSIGILQGRLTKAPLGKFQFYPKRWEPEFKIAEDIGFSSIEWLFDWPDYKNNTLWTIDGRKAIFRTVRLSGVQVNSICADYFMKYRLWGREAPRSIKVLDKLIKYAGDAQHRLVLVPFLEGNALKTENEKNEVVANIKKLFNLAGHLDVRIGFETEMTANELTDFLDRFQSDRVGAYYDIGNCTSYGFDCPADIRRLGKRIFGIHAKDRKVNSTQSVYLGTGDADYLGCLKALKSIGFDGTIIVQAWRSNDYLADAKRQYLYLTGLLKSL